MLSLHYAVYILHHHNRVIDNDTDSEDKAEQGEHVERESEYEHDAECTDKRDRHSDNRNERCAPVLQ